MNKKEALELVKEDGSELENLPDIFKKDKEIVLAAVCLLYTSPSPRDRQKSRMPSSA
mgnify:CR=1 FL=1